MLIIFTFTLPLSRVIQHLHCYTITKSTHNALTQHIYHNHFVQYYFILILHEHTEQTLKLYTNPYKFTQQ
jgi:hypothetical protein